MAEKDTSTLLILTVDWCSGRIELEEVGVQIQIQACLLPLFYYYYSFIVILPFGFLVFILTADPVNFARFLRKHIFSLLDIIV